MPPSTDILSGLTAIANDWRLVAIVWHVLLGAFLLGLVAGWRPLTRDVGLLLVAPLVSVSTLAWMSGNPFNAVVFALLSLVLSWLAVRLPRIAVRIDSPVRAVAGTLLVVFGWVYPHFSAHGCADSLSLRRAPRPRSVPHAVRDRGPVTHRRSLQLPAMGGRAVRSGRRLWRDRCVATRRRHRRGPRRRGRSALGS